MARGAHAPDDRARIVRAREDGRNVIGELDPARGRVEHIRRDVEAVPDFRPPPLGRVRPADRREVLRRLTPRRLGDQRGLRRGRVVFPEPRVRREVLRPPGVERERLRARVDRQRRGSGGIDADPDDAVAGEAGAAFGVREGAVHRGAQPREVVRRVLARQMRVARIEQHAVIAARIRKDARSGGRAVRAIHDDGADRVRAVVDPERERGHPTRTGDTTSSTSGPVPFARAWSSAGWHARTRTAFSARFAKLIMLRSIARVGSSRYVN